MTSPLATELRLRTTSRLLQVTFQDGVVFELPFEYLRTHSPSAEVEGPWARSGSTRHRQVRCRYSRHRAGGPVRVKLVFDDGHDTGLYTWKYLYELGRDREVNWERYQARVARGA